MMEKKVAVDRRPNSPKLGRILVVCLVVAAFCAILAWYASTHLGQCCDLSFLGKMLH